ncbi:MAG TPA: hypothetical protein VNO21_14420, partial [Polyangiaceae bacterium]|nr:hypothetical protein [Polyangiaceae bacterium]
FLTPDGDALWFASHRHPYDNVTTLFQALATEGYASGHSVSGVTSADGDKFNPVLSWDKNTLYFAKSRDVDGGSREIWVARRNTDGGGFDQPVEVKQLNTSLSQMPSWLSPDQCHLYFTRDNAIYRAERPLR